MNWCSEILDIKCDSEMMCRCSSMGTRKCVTTEGLSTSINCKYAINVEMSDVCVKIDERQNKCCAQPGGSVQNCSVIAIFL